MPLPRSEPVIYHERRTFTTGRCRRVKIKVVESVRRADYRQLLTSLAEHFAETEEADMERGENFAIAFAEAFAGCQLELSTEAEAERARLSMRLSRSLTRQGECWHNLDRLAFRHNITPGEAIKCIEWWRGQRDPTVKARLIRDRDEQRQAARDAEAAQKVAWKEASERKRLVKVKNTAARAKLAQLLADPATADYIDVELARRAGCGVGVVKKMRDETGVKPPVRRTADGKTIHTRQYRAPTKAA